MYFVRRRDVLCKSYSSENISQPKVEFSTGHSSQGPMKDMFPHIVEITTHYIPQLQRFVDANISYFVGPCFSLFVFVTFSSLPRSFNSFKVIFCYFLKMSFSFCTPDKNYDKCIYFHSILLMNALWEKRLYNTSMLVAFGVQNCRLDHFHVHKYIENEWK